MTEKKFKEKYNEGCIKVFNLITLLFEDRANYDDVISIFSESDDNKQHVTLNKYLNTLKVFGIDVKKVKNKFKIKNFPFALNFDNDDLKALSYLKKYSQSLPNGKTKNALTNLTETIQSRFNENNQQMFNEIDSNNTVQYFDTPEKFTDILQLCEKYCDDNYKIYIEYLTDDNNQIHLYANPIQVIMDKDIACIKIHNINEETIETIPVEKILFIRQIPTQIELKNPKTITYKLKGRLASAYIPKEEYEYITNTESDGAIVIVNRNEPYNDLLRRLMRYDYDCEIISPKNARKDMRDLIINTLKNYE